jgi:hypothetical protein
MARSEDDRMGFGADIETRLMQPKNRALADDAAATRPGTEEASRARASLAVALGVGVGSQALDHAVAQAAERLGSAAHPARQRRPARRAR